MTKQPTIPPGLRFLLSAACIVIVVAGLKAARTVLVPLALAIFIAVVSLPLLHLARRRGVPTGLAIFFVVVFDAAALFLLGWLVSLAALEIQTELPGYLIRLQELEGLLIVWFAEKGIEVGQVATVWFPAEPGGEPSIWQSFDVQRLLGVATYLVGKATSIVTTTFLVVLIFIFMLAEASRIPAKLRLIAGRDNADLGRSAKVIREIQHYLGIKTLISAATGLTLGVAMWGLGIDFPLLWGLLAFVLNFIPNVGSIIAALPPVAVALLQVGPGSALMVVLVFVGVNALFGNFLEPMLVGHQLGISTLVVILSLVFWGWVWGPVGMFLSVPLTMGLKIGLENSDEFRWLAILMAAGGREQVGTQPVLAAIAPSTQAPAPAAPPSSRANTGIS